MALLALGAGHAEAAEIKVISAGAVRSIVSELAPAFERPDQEKDHASYSKDHAVSVVR